MSDYEKQVQAAMKPLIGKKLVAVRFLTKQEAEQCGWFNRPIVLVFEDGTTVFPQSDDEGNDGGALGTTLKSAPVIGVLRT